MAPPLSPRDKRVAVPWRDWASDYAVIYTNLPTVPEGEHRGVLTRIEESAAPMRLGAIGTDGRVDSDQSVKYAETCLMKYSGPRDALGAP